MRNFEIRRLKDILFYINEKDRATHGIGKSGQLSVRSSQTSYSGRVFYRKKSISPPMEGGLYDPQHMKRSISPPKFSKTGQITP